jgi:signal transduction histidine kinase
MRLENFKGNYEKADQYFDLYEAHMDSVFNAETTAAISEMQVKYETAQKTNALEQEKLKTRNTQLWLIIAVISGILLLIFALYIRYRKKLSEQKLRLKALEQVEVERGRIARDLHDNLGADLSLITSKIDIQAYKQNDPNFKSDLERISTLSRSANAQLRDTIWSIHKSTLTLGELAMKIVEFGDRIFLDTKTKLKVESLENQFIIQPSKALHLYRICQEFINNSFKYANASEVQIIITNNMISLKDNGRGFGLSEVSKGYGLNNIESRAIEMGATINWKNENGTHLTISFTI